MPKACWLSSSERGANHWSWPCASPSGRWIKTRNGEKCTATREEWKDVFTAALKRESRIAMGIDGGGVMLGHSTSKMRKAEFSELIELIYSYGSESGIHWSEKAQAVYAEYREANQ